eukprot:4385063-Pleurochrysis_carterae.AAC.2
MGLSAANCGEQNEQLPGQQLASPLLMPWHSEVPHRCSCLAAPLVFSRQAISVCPQNGFIGADEASRSQGKSQNTV